MNNPESNLMSPPSRPPPNKKVRGGATPRLMVPGSRSAAAATSAAVGPPPTGGGGGPPTFSTMTSSTTTSTTPMSSSIPSNVSGGSARRQAELRRLRDLRAKGSTTATSRTAAGQHPSQLPTTAAAATGGASASNETDVDGPPPMRPAGQQRHHSDLFPFVAKKPSPVPPPKAVIGTVAEGSSGQAPPTISLAPPQGSETPPVQRKLEYSNDGSVPPKSSPPSVLASTAREKAAAAAQAKREVSKPPGAVAPRSKSAPPRRPKGPPPPAGSLPPAQPRPTTTPSKNLPFSRTAERVRMSLEKNGPPGSPTRVAAMESRKSPHRIQSSRTTAASTGPLPPAGSFSSPPANTAATGASGKEAKKVYPKTPIPPKEAGGGIGDKTPPSTGNSSRREKIKLMREGAAAAATVSPSGGGTTDDVTKTDGPLEEKTGLTTATAPPVQTSEVKESVPEPSAESSTSPTDAFEQAVAKQRLEQAYEDVTAEKDTYLKQVKELEEKLRKKDDEITAMRTQKINDQSNENVPSTPSRGFLKSIASSLGTPMRHTKTSERVLAPKLPFEENAVQLERSLISHFREAVTCVPFEYESDIATFTIRRPYGSDDLYDLFGVVSLMPPDLYNRRAHVSESEALEVVATIHGDNSLFLLFGKAGVRYKTNPQAPEWITIENVDDDPNMTGPLPVVTYVADDATDQQYSLEIVLEEALKCREQYCKTVTSTAIGFMNRPPAPADPSVQDGLQLEKAPSRDIGTETEEQGPVSTVQVGSNTEGSGGGANKPQEPAKEADVDTSSSDVLTVFIGMIFSSFFGLIYSIFIGLPLQIIRTTFVLTAAFAILSTLYLYTAHDIYGTRDMLFMTNTYPGVM